MELSASVQANQTESCIMKKSRREMKRLRDEWDAEVHPSNTTKAVKARARKHRKFMVNTCPMSRHVQMIGENLLRDGIDYMTIEEPVNVGTTLIAAAAEIYKLRSELAAFKQERKRA
jgi:MOSC domain-containing protein YiiM